MMAVYTHLKGNDIQKIANDYGLIVANFEPIESGAANSNYLLHTRQGNYVLTVFDEGTFDDVIGLGRLLFLLAEYDFPTTRLLFPATGGMITMHKDNPVMIKVHIAGQVYRDLDKKMLCQVGAAMAELHQMPAPDFLSDEQPYGLPQFPSVVGQNIDLEYETWIARRLPRLERRVPQELPSGLIHGDIFYDNVLFAGKKLVAIIDFECALRYYKGFDLGMGIVGLCRRKSIVALDKARALVEGYQQIRRLEEREKKALQLFVEYAATLVSCWRFWKYHIDTPDVEKADKHWRMVRTAEGIRGISPLRFLEMVFG